jgi:hypothetical protein
MLSSCFTCVSVYCRGSWLKSKSGEKQNAKLNFDNPSPPIFSQSKALANTANPVGICFPLFSFLSPSFVRALFSVESPERMHQLADDLALVSFHFTKPRPFHELSCQLTADAPTRVSTFPAAWATPTFACGVQLSCVKGERGRTAKKIILLRCFFILQFLRSMNRTMIGHSTSFSKHKVRKKTAWRIFNYQLKVIVLNLKGTLTCWKEEWSKKKKLFWIKMIHIHIHTEVRTKSQIWTKSLHLSKSGRKN